VKGGRSLPSHESAIGTKPLGLTIPPGVLAIADVAAWKQKPRYAVIPMQDRMINPDLERFMTKRAQSQVTELPGSHAIFLSHAPEVAALIEKAATEAK
jgi:hypothetical protein